MRPHLTHLSTMQSPIKLYLTLGLSLFAISSANGNYGYGQYNNAQCNRDAYTRAQNNIRMDMQRSPLQPQPPYDASYPGISNGYQGNNQPNQQLDNQCRLTRQSFIDLVTNTPLCETINSYTFQTSASLIEQGRRYLQNNCERNQGHQFLSCFKNYEVLQCESQFTYARNRVVQQNPPPVNSGYNPQPNYSPYTVNYEICQTYDTFRNCVISTTNRHCLASDQEHIATYLVDNARNLAWSCSPQNTLGSSINPSVINPSYPRRTDIISGSSYPNQYPSGSYPSANPSNPFSSRQMPTYQYGSNYPETNRFGGALDGAVNIVSIDVCTERVKPFRDSCYDLMNQRQRDARHGRSSNDVQRRICCAAFYFRDCLSRAVLEHCPHSTTAAVEIMMGDIQRQVSTCRDYNREQCSGVSPLQGSILAILVTFMLAFLSQ